MKANRLFALLVWKCKRYMHEGWKWTSTKDDIGYYANHGSKLYKYL